MGIIEQQAQEIQTLRREFEEFKDFVSDYMTQVDDEIKGYSAASRFLGCSVSKLERLVRSNLIPYTKHGKTISFSREDLVKHKRQRRNEKRGTYTLNRAA